METLVPTKLKARCALPSTRPISRGRGRLVREVADAAGMVKIGMELFYAHGAAGYGRLRPKACRLPRPEAARHPQYGTRARLPRSCGSIRVPAVVNVHATGGSSHDAGRGPCGRGRCKVIAVTVLTSLSDDDLAASVSIRQACRKPGCTLARLAQDCGLDGVVCSPVDLPAIRAACGPDFLTVVPGPAAATARRATRSASPRRLKPGRPAPTFW
jgi:orotidine-5'-phosphate decarboxylase